MIRRLRWLNLVATSGGPDERLTASAINDAIVRRLERALQRTQDIFTEVVLTVCVRHTALVATSVDSVRQTFEIAFHPFINEVQEVVLVIGQFGAFVVE